MWPAVGKDSMGTYPNSLQEVKLTMQEDQMCESHLHNYYTTAIQLCIGDPKTKKASFKVRMTSTLLGSGEKCVCRRSGTWGPPHPLGLGPLSRSTRGNSRSRKDRESLQATQDLQ